MANFPPSTFDEYGICVGQDAKTLSGKSLKKSIAFHHFCEQRLTVQTVLGQGPHRIHRLSVDFQAGRSGVKQVD